MGRRCAARSTRLGLACGAFLVALVFLGWWAYAPRLRSADPGRSLLAGAALVDGPLMAQLWISHPHQNLAVLSRDPSELVGALFRLAGRETPSLPRFLVFSIPPSREMTVALDPDGDRYLLAFRLDPFVAVAVRTAGWLSSNPWLKGGDVTSLSRPGQVGWKGRTWWLGSSPVADLEPGVPGAGAEGEKALARLELVQAWGAVPPGGYSIRNDGLVLRLAGDGGASSREGLQWPSAADDLALAVLEVDGSRRRGLVLLDREMTNGDLPAAIMRPVGQGRMPGEKLLEELDIHLRRRPLPEGWEMLALSEWAVDAAEPAGRWLLDRWRGDGGGSQRLEILVRPGPALKWADDLLRTGRRLRLLDRDRYGAWRQLAEMGAVAGTCRELHFLVSPSANRMEGHLDCGRSD